MPSPSVKALIESFSSHLSKVFAVRSKCPTKNRRTQCSSTTHHEGHDSISADIPIVHPGSSAGDPSLGFSIIFSSATASHGNSVARTISDVVQTVGPFAQGVACAIPVVGSPIQAAISGLLTLLQVIDRRTQNRADLDHLTSRLQGLSLYLCNAPTTQDPSEQHRREAIIRILEETSAQLRRLENRRLEFASVTQVIAGCSIEIDRYLANYLFSSQMQNRHDMAEVLAILQRQQDSVEPASIQLTALGCVKIVDATGHEHPISVTFCTSFQQLNDMLQVLFKSESIEARIQRRYMEQGQYDLCIDDDKQVIQLTSHEWPSIEAGTTIVMRVILEQETLPEVEYRCHFCRTVNRISAEHLLQRQAIDCRVCKRRFQISRGNGPRRKTQSCIDSIPGSEAEMHLIRNFHVQQTPPYPRIIPRIIGRRASGEIFIHAAPIGIAASGKHAAPPPRPPRPIIRIIPPEQSSAVNVAACDLNAGGASAMSYSHRNEVFRNGSTLPRPDAYAHNRIEEIYQDSDDDYNEDSSADSGEDYDEWDDREDHEA